MEGIPFSRNHSTSLQVVTIQGTNTKDIHGPPPGKITPHPAPAREAQTPEEEAGGNRQPRVPAALATHPLLPEFLRVSKSQAWFCSRVLALHQVLLEPSVFC